MSGAGRYRGALFAAVTAIAATVTTAPTHAADLRYESRSVQLPGKGYGSAGVQCDPGFHVLGGGQHVFAEWGTTILNSSGPDDDRDRRRVPDDGWRASVTSLRLGNTMTVHAICGRREPRYPSVKIRVPGQQLPRRGTPRCPAATRVTGGGAWTTGRQSQHALIQSFPFDGGDPAGTPDDGWRSVGYVFGGAPARRMTVTAICARTRPGYTSAPGTAPAGSSGEAFAPCAGNRRVVGGGFEIDQGPVIHFATISSPYQADDGPPDDGWRAEFDNGNLGGTTDVVVHAICLR
jgi:hypothetical protein